MMTKAASSSRYVACAGRARLGAVSGRISRTPRKRRLPCGRSPCSSGRARWASRAPAASYRSPFSMENSISLGGSTWPSRSRWRSNREQSTCCRMPGSPVVCLTSTPRRTWTAIGLAMVHGNPWLPRQRGRRPKQGRNMPQVVTDAGNAAGLIFKGRESSGQFCVYRFILRLLRAPPASEQSACRRSGSPYPAQAVGLVRIGPSRERQQCGIARRLRPRIGGADPDRPHMIHGQQTPKDDFQPAQLTGVPSGLQQMIAVSDAGEGEAHPFVYLWADPADADKMKRKWRLRLQRHRGRSRRRSLAKAPLQSRTRPPLQRAAAQGGRGHGGRRPEAGVYQRAVQGL